MPEVVSQCNSIQYGASCSKHSIGRMHCPMLTPEDCAKVFRGSCSRLATAASIQASTAFQSSRLMSARGANRAPPSASSRASTAFPHAQKCVYDLRCSDDRSDCTWDLLRGHCAPRKPVRVTLGIPENHLCQKMWLPHSASSQGWTALPHAQNCIMYLFICQTEILCSFKNLTRLRKQSLGTLAPSLGMAVNALSRPSNNFSSLRAEVHV